eukprot:scaffold28279_cov134-Isochrysis_galbana.AAC.4
MLRVEEEKRKMVSRVHDHAGPRVRQKSIREGDSIRVRHRFLCSPTSCILISLSPPTFRIVLPPLPLHST